MDDSVRINRGRMALIVKKLMAIGLSKEAAETVAASLTTIVDEEIGSIGSVNKISNVNLMSKARVIRNIKTKKGLKVGHMGLEPMKVELPPKTLNRLQTKLERQATEEEKFLTVEELERRSNYARLMKKSDSYLKDDDVEWITKGGKKIPIGGKGEGGKGEAKQPPKPIPRPMSQKEISGLLKHKDPQKQLSAIPHITDPKQLEELIEGSTDTEMEKGALGRLIHLSKTDKNAKNAWDRIVGNIEKQIENQLLKQERIKKNVEKRGEHAIGMSEIMTKMEKEEEGYEKVKMEGGEMRERAKQREYEKNMEKELINQEKMEKELERLYRHEKERTMEKHAPKSTPRKGRSLKVKFKGKKDSVWIETEAFFDAINNGLKNIIKINVTLAKELIQPYDRMTKDGKKVREYHYKPYIELKKAIQHIDELPIIIEHQDSVTDKNQIGCVRELYADDKSKSIKGVAYLIRSKLPYRLLDALEKKSIVAVSIGFFAVLGGSGIFDGKKYDFIQERMILHHLAVCLDSIPRCPIDLCGLNLDSTNQEINDSVVFIKPQNIVLSIINSNLEKAHFNEMRDVPNKNNQKQKIEINDMSQSEQDIIDTFSAEIKELESKVKAIEDATIAKDINARLSKLYKFINAYKEGVPTVESHGEIIERSIKSIGKSGGFEMDAEELSQIISDAVTKAVQSKDEEIKELKDTFMEFIDSQKLAKSEAEKATEKAKYLDNIEKFGKHLKLSDAYIKEQSLEVLKVLSDSVLNVEPSTAPATKLPTGKPASQKDGEKPMVELHDGTKVEKVDFSKVFDSVQEDFNMASIFVDDDIEFASNILDE